MSVHLTHIQLLDLGSMVVRYATADGDATRYQLLVTYITQETITACEAIPANGKGIIVTLLGASRSGPHVTMFVNDYHIPQVSYIQEKLNVMNSKDAENIRDALLQIHRIAMGEEHSI